MSIWKPAYLPITINSLGSYSWKTDIRQHLNIPFFIFEKYPSRLQLSLDLRVIKSILCVSHTSIKTKFRPGCKKSKPHPTNIAPFRVFYTQCTRRAFCYDWGELKAQMLPTAQGNALGKRRPQLIHSAFLHAQKCHAPKARSPIKDSDCGKTFTYLWI